MARISKTIEKARSVREKYIAKLNGSLVQLDVLALKASVHRPVRETYGSHNIPDVMVALPS